MSLSVKSAKRYYDSLHESLKRELPQWENLSCGCTRNLKVFLMSLSILNRVDRNLLIECIRDCEKEIAARSKDGSIQEGGVRDAITEVIGRSEKRRGNFKSMLATVFSYRGICAKGKSEEEKHIERKNREHLREQTAVATA